MTLVLKTLETGTNLLQTAGVLTAPVREGLLGNRGESSELLCGAVVASLMTAIWADTRISISQPNSAG